MDKKRPISVYFKPELRERVQSLAQLENRSFNNMVETLCERELNRQEPPSSPYGAANPQLLAFIYEHRKRQVIECCELVQSLASDFSLPTGFESSIPKADIYLFLRSVLAPPELEIAREYLGLSAHELAAVLMESAE